MKKYKNVLYNDKLYIETEIKKINGLVEKILEEMKINSKPSQESF